MMYFWSSDVPMFYVEEQLQISRPTLVDWHNFNCDLCCQWVDNHFIPIGGLDENFEEKIVEIDKSCFFCRKHHVGCMVHINGFLVVSKEEVRSVS